MYIYILMSFNKRFAFLLQWVLNFLLHAFYLWIFHNSLTEIKMVTTWLSSPVIQLTANMLAMFSGSFVAGIVGPSFHLTRRQLAYLNSFGCGLLLGTALCVVLPEGVSTLYESEEHDPNREKKLGTCSTWFYPTSI